MRNGLLLVALCALAAESVAYACSCMTTDDPVELRKFAGEAAGEAIALVEAEALTAFDGRGEQMTVHRTLAGIAPAKFQVQRGPMPSSASCDDLYQPGQRRIIILYPAKAAAGAMPVYRTSGLCTNLLLDKPVYRDTVAALIGGAARAGERG